MSGPESSFRNNQVNPFLKKLKNTWAVSVQQQGIRGTPDKLLCVRGHFVALELKAEGGRLTPLQEHNLGLIGKAGGLPLVATPSTWGKIKLILQQLDQGEET